MKRLTSIDALRGLVMFLMLVDHAREFFFFHQQVSDPVNLETTSAELFFTRLSAHLCAPVFVFLTGLSAWLYHQKNDLSETTKFLLQRGLILVALEFTVINFGWSFDFTPSTIFLQVIWAIGISMVTLSALIHLPRPALIAVGFIIVLGHNLLSPISFAPSETGYNLWAIIHDRGYIELFNGMKARTSYPVLPWIGLMSLGFAIGPWFSTQYNDKRVRTLWITSATSMGLFLILRFINGYGEPLPWSTYDSTLMTVMSFLNLTKYPPSADFLLFTISIGLFFLGLFEKYQTRVNILLSTFGSVPMFYYIVHIYALNIIHSSCEIIWGENFGVPEVKYLWIISLVMAIPLWFASRWYAGVKKRYPASVLRFF